MNTDRIEWDDLSREEKLDLIPEILERLNLEVWFYKMDGKARSLELRERNRGGDDD